MPTVVRTRRLCKNADAGAYFAFIDEATEVMRHGAVLAGFAR
jgi:hypothetical protein